MSEGLLDVVNKRFSDLRMEDDAAYDEMVEQQLMYTIPTSDVEWRGSSKVINVSLNNVKTNVDRKLSFPRNLDEFRGSVDRVSCGLKKRAGNLSIARHGDLLMITLLHNTIKSDVQQPTVTTPISNAPSNPKTHASDVATPPRSLPPTTSTLTYAPSNPHHVMNFAPRYVPVQHLRAADAVSLHRTILHSLMRDDSN